MVSTLGNGIGLKLLGKAFSLLPQLGGGGKEGVEHSNAHMRLVLSMIATLHIGLDTLLEHKVMKFPCSLSFFIVNAIVFIMVVVFVKR